MRNKQARRAREALKYTAEELAERKRLKTLIKNGKLPRYHFVKDENDKLPRGIRQRGWEVRYTENPDGSLQKHVVPRMRGIALVTLSTFETLTKK